MLLLVHCLGVEQELIKGILNGTAFIHGILNRTGVHQGLLIGTAFLKGILDGLLLHTDTSPALSPSNAAHDTVCHTLQPPGWSTHVTPNAAQWRLAGSL
jgi:hypothetical protein